MTGRRIACYSPDRIELEPFDLPEEPAAGEVLVEVEASLISPGTELSGYFVERKAPGYPGYTAVGLVRAVGAGVDARLRGQRVYVFPEQHDSQGCHASHKLVAAGGLVLPVGDLDPAVACFARMINIALTPFCLAGPSPRGPVLVVGLGLVGQFLVHVARLKGYGVLALDPDESRRRRAREGGADEAIDPTTGDPVARIKALTGGRGAGLVVNATGATATFPMSLACVAPGGELNTLGGCRGECQIELSSLLSRVQWEHVTIRGGWEMLLPRRASLAGGPSTEANLHQAFDWLRRGDLRLEPIWTHSIRPEAFAGAYAALAAKEAGWMGVVVDWRG